MKPITEKKPIRMLNSVHPGRFLKTKIIEANELSVTEAAKILRVAAHAFQSFECEGRSLRRHGPPIREGLWLDMETLMRMQNSFDIAQTRSREKAIRVDRYHKHPAA